MKRSLCIARTLTTCLMMAGALSAANAIERGATSTGIAYVSGGVGHSELTALYEEKKRYSFWLTTAAKRSGSYLAAVQVRILNARTRQPVLEHTMDGPWLFVALPVGRYDVEASYYQIGKGPVQTQKQITTIHPGDNHQMVLYFDTDDQLGPENQTPFKTSPYSDR
jgi:hypothetical protein